MTNFIANLMTNLYDILECQVSEPSSEPHGGGGLECHLQCHLECHLECHLQCHFTMLFCMTFKLAKFPSQVISQGGGGGSMQTS